MPDPTPAAAVRLRGISLRHGRTEALRDISLDIAADVVTGLVGRNGAGKTSLLRVIADFEPRHRGTVEAFGRVMLTSDRWAAAADQSVASMIGHLRRTQPGFDADRAHELLSRFGVPARAGVLRLSRGQASAAQVSLALASRAPITLLDEPHLGLDAPSRDLFAALVVEELQTHPRTIVISTHLIDETAPLFERLIVLDAGRVVADDDVDTLLGRWVRVQGSEARMAGVPLLQPERLGGRVTGIVERTILDAVGADGARVSSLSVQELAGVLPLASHPSPQEAS